jgi:hypothetical protein
LSSGGDTCVAEVEFRYCILDLRGSEGNDSRFRIAVLTGCSLDGGEFSLMGPFEESVPVDVEDATDLSGGEEFVIHKGFLFLLKKSISLDQFQMKTNTNKQINPTVLTLTTRSY